MDTDSFAVYIIVINTLQEMFKLDLIHQIINQIGHYQKGKIEKATGKDKFMKDKLGSNIMIAKTYSCLIYDGNKEKKSKRHKNVYHEKKIYV